MKKDNESFSDLLDRILNEYESNKGNYKILMKDVFGSGKQVFDNKFMSEFKKIRTEINPSFNA